MNKTSEAGMVDELSLFLVPVTDSSSGSASLFTQVSSLTEGEQVEFFLRSGKNWEWRITAESSAPKQKGIVKTQKYKLQNKKKLLVK